MWKRYKFVVDAKLDNLCCIIIIWGEGGSIMSKNKRLGFNYRALISMNFETH